MFIEAAEDTVTVVAEPFPGSKGSSINDVNLFQGGWSKIVSKSGNLGKRRGIHISKTGDVIYGQYLIQVLL